MSTKAWSGFRYQNPLKERLKDEFFDALPTTPGVYFMLGEGGHILYVGKAKSLKKRLATYKNARPGREPEHIIEMIEGVRRIHWEDQPTEARALAREFDLIRQLKPPFNIAGAWPELDSYIAIKGEERRLHLRLSSAGPFEEGFKVFGVYPHRARTKAGYGALLRLLYAVNTPRERFHVPAKIAGAVPAYRCAVPFDPAHMGKVTAFLGGRSDALLKALMQGLLANECIPPFMHAGFEEDLRRLKEFFRVMGGVPVPKFPQAG